jgi:hypothetical protein
MIVIQRQGLSYDLVDFILGRKAFDDLLLVPFLIFQYPPYFPLPRSSH